MPMKFEDILDKQYHSIKEVDADIKEAMKSRVKHPTKLAKKNMILAALYQKKSAFFQQNEPEHESFLILAKIMLDDAAAFCENKGVNALIKALSDAIDTELQQLKNPPESKEDEMDGAYVDLTTIDNLNEAIQKAEKSIHRITAETKLAKASAFLAQLYEAKANFLTDHNVERKNLLIKSAHLYNKAWNKHEKTANINNGARIVRLLEGENPDPEKRKLFASTTAQINLELSSDVASLQQANKTLQDAIILSNFCNAADEEVYNQINMGVACMEKALLMKKNKNRFGDYLSVAEEACIHFDIAATLNPAVHILELAYNASKLALSEDNMALNMGKLVSLAQGRHDNGHRVTNQNISKINKCVKDGIVEQQMDIEAKIEQMPAQPSRSMSGF